MATTMVQVRVDSELRKQAAEICDNLGIDLPTAIRIFMKRTVMENGIPFSMKLPKVSAQEQCAVSALHALSEAAQKNGTADLSLEEINAEIDACRKEHA
ncbi:type II toxin-antitoxin system RelB/DinJ family antitoxin [Phascolarctobacterium sp.]|uniref:type II toxin-antitoxin system RelB/DinJ family antitoxin n=1 Tax=Phascolarctobacterium sp. TaxID=2049039 RepID=UPI0038666A7B